MSERMSLTFGTLLQAAVDEQAARRLERVRGFERDAVGAGFQIPASPFLGRASLRADDVAGADVRETVGMADYPVERATALLDMMQTFVVRSTRGKIPIGDGPEAVMAAESSARGFVSEAIAEREYTIDSVVKVDSRYSTQLVVEAGENQDIANAIERSQAAAIRTKLLEQIVSGDGHNHNLSGVLSATGIGSATYAQADRGSHGAFLTAEAVVEDADSDPMTSAWLLGSVLSDSARSVAIEPGSYRRTEERGRMSLSGYRSFRSDSTLPATTGVFCDWASLALVMAGSVQMYLDRVTSPGETIVTSRLPVASPIVTRPGRVYRLSEA